MKTPTQPFPAATGIPDKADRADGTAFKVLGAISFSHMLNDMIQ